MVQGIATPVSVVVIGMGTAIAARADKVETAEALVVSPCRARPEGNNVALISCISPTPLAQLSRQIAPHL